MEKKLEEVVARFLGQAYSMPSEEVDLENSLGRWMAEDVRARFPWPPFHRSTRDGFALNHRVAAAASSEQPILLRVGETIAAGEVNNFSVNDGAVARIFTGALLPPGATAVIPFEEVEVQPEAILVSRPVQHGQYIRRKGSVIEVGEVVVSRGTRISPAEIELLATNGMRRVRVSRKPVVSILPVGSELIEPGNELVEGKIYSSNGYTMSAWIQEWGGAAHRQVAIGDDLGLIVEQVQSLLPISDVVITTGGTCDGAFDLAPRVLEELGASGIIRLITKTTGGPFVGGFVGTCPVLSLSGSPKAAVRSGKIFLKPLLAKMQGAEV